MKKFGSKRIPVFGGRKLGMVGERLLTKMGNVSAMNHALFPVNE
jgi:hypothetical protein